MQESTIKAAVREHYARAAGGGCCAGSSASCCADVALDGEAAVRGVPSFGCGTPVEAAALRQGEVVVDLGSGRGLDAFRAARQVGLEGRVIGVDMTPEMVWRAREDAARLGYPQVTFRLGEIEALPLPEGVADVVISNCVINLVPDKDRAFAEACRVLRAGGRLIVSDIVRAPGSPAPAVDLEGWAACVDGADPEDVYLARIRGAGFTDVEVLGRGDADTYSVTVRARKG